MAHNDSLAKGVVKFSISTWVNLIVGFFSVVITTRIITPSDYGMITLFITASALLLYLLTLGLDSAFIRYYNEPPVGNTNNQLLYKSLSFSTLLCLLVGGVTIVFFSKEASVIIFGIESRLLISLLLIYSLSQVWLRYLNISFRMSFRAKQYNIQNILINCLTRVLIILSAFFSSGYMFIISILTIGITATLFVYLIVQREEIKPYNATRYLDYSLRISNMSSYFRFAFFSAPTYIVVYFNTFMAQQIIREEIDTYALGVFASTSMLVSVLTALKGGFATYWSAYVYKNYSNEQAKISLMHDYIVVFSILISSLIVIFRDVIYLFIGQNYHSSKVFFSLILILPILNFIRETTDKGIEISNRNEISLTAHAVAVFVNLGLCYLLIPILGITGAAVANAISAITLFIITAIYGQKFYRSINDYFKTAKGVFLLLLILTIPSLTGNMLLICFLVICLDVMGLVLYREEVKQMLLILKSYKKG